VDLREVFATVNQNDPTFEKFFTRGQPWQDLEVTAQDVSVTGLQTTIVDAADATMTRLTHLSEGASLTKQFPQ